MCLFSYKIFKSDNNICCKVGCQIVVSESKVVVREQNLSMPEKSMISGSRKKVVPEQNRIYKRFIIYNTSYSGTRANPMPYLIGL